MLFHLNISKTLSIYDEVCFYFLQERRLRGRGTETEEAIQKRLETSKKEFEYGKLVSGVILFSHLLPLKMVFFFV